MHGWWCSSRDPTRSNDRRWSHLSRLRVRPWQRRQGRSPRRPRGLGSDRGVDHRLGPRARTPDACGPWSDDGPRTRIGRVRTHPRAIDVGADRRPSRGGGVDGGPTGRAAAHDPPSRGAPASLPSLVDRVRGKIGVCEHASRPTSEDEAQRLASSLPTGSALCHGDLHPGNVLMSDRGTDRDRLVRRCGRKPDRRRGPFLAPRATPEQPSVVCRTSPEPSPDVLERLHRDYVRHVLAGVDIAPTLVRSWEAVLAAGRLAERAERDDSELVALWRGRDDQLLSPLVRMISPLGISDQQRADRRHQIR